MSEVDLSSMIGLTEQEVVVNLSRQGYRVRIIKCNGRSLDYSFCTCQSCSKLIDSKAMIEIDNGLASKISIG